MDPQSASSQASSQEVSGLQGLVQGGMASVAKPSSPAPPSPAAGPTLSGDAANLQKFLNSTEPTLPMAQQRPGWLDSDDPLDSYSAATLSGIKSIVRGGRDAVKGTVQLLDPRPQNQEEEAIVELNQQNRAALPLYRILRSMGHTASQATQVAGAFHDINQSPDPLGTYLKVGQETAGQGAGQALTAIATEGLTRAIPKVPAALDAAIDSPATQAVAAGTKAALKKLPAAAVKRIPYVGKVAGDVADAARTAYSQVKTARTAAAAPGASAADELEGVTSPQTEAAGEIPDEAEVAETPAPQARPPKPARKPATSAAPKAPATEVLAKEFASKVYGHLRNMLGMEGTAETSAPAATGAPAEAAPAEASAAAPKESAEDFVNRQLPKPNGGAQAKPAEAKPAEAQALDPETGEPVSEPDAWDKLPKEEQQRRLDEYYAKHPEQKPKPQSWQRGPKKGQPKVRRVFDEGKWHEVQVYE